MNSGLFSNPLQLLDYAIQQQSVATRCHLQSLKYWYKGHRTVSVFIFYFFLQWCFFCFFFFGLFLWRQRLRDQMFFFGTADVWSVGENASLFFTNDQNISAMGPRENTWLSARCVTVVTLEDVVVKTSRQLKERLERLQKQSKNKRFLSVSQALSQLVRIVSFFLSCLHL